MPKTDRRGETRETYLVTVEVKARWNSYSGLTEAAVRKMIRDDPPSVGLFSSRYSYESGKVVKIEPKSAAVRYAECEGYVWCDKHSTVHVADTLDPYQYDEEDAWCAPDDHHPLYRKGAK